MTIILNGALTDVAADATVGAAWMGASTLVRHRSLPLRASSAATKRYPEVT